MTLHQPLQPLAADGGALARILQAADVDKTNLIRVVGPLAPIAMLWLSQHGYDRAVFAPNGGANGTPADALLIAHPCSAEELGSLVGDTDGVREDGTIIVQTRPGRQGGEPEAVAAWLRRSGFASQRRFNDKGRPICIARRIGFPIASKAA
jgi:hypothetical protein